MSRTLRLLQVADSSGDAELVVRLLLKADYTVEARRVQDAGAMKSALADSGWDLIVCDYRMQKFDAPAALATLHEAGLDIPFLVVSGTTGVDVAVAMMKAGAHDYLMKDNLTPLGATVKRELRDAETRAERRGALHQLQEREARFALAAASTEMGIFDYNPGTGKVLYSDVFKRHLDVPPELEPTLAGFLELLHPEDRPRIGRSVERAFLPESGGHYAEEYRTKAMVNGEAKWVSAWGRVLYDGEKPVRFLGVVRDITERKRAELELQFQLRLTACITQQSTDCILLADVDNRIRLVNPEVCRVFGYTMEECQGKIPHELLHHHYPDGRPYPASECMLSQMMRSGEDLRDHEDLLFHKDGTPIDVGGSGVPLTLNGVRVGTMFTFRDIRERKSAERALLQSDVRFRRLFEADIVGIVISDGERIVETNDHFLHLLGYTREEFLAQEMYWNSITPANVMEVSERLTQSLISTGSCAPFERTYLRKDGTHVPVLFSAVALSLQPERRFLGFVVDLTDQKNLESQFRQAQKLESIGQLAGGAAHDFNNLLTVIGGYAELGLTNVGPQHPVHAALNQIASAAGKAAGLTRQLLTFSRMNAGTPKTIAPGDLVTDIEEMLRRLIGEQVEVTLALGADKGFIHADPGLIEQVIVNLAVNARDAMPDGGSLYIESARRVVADEFAALCLGVRPGTYISLEVTDTGTGMTPEVQARLFEPFFTTKAPGKGRGLGLSTVYGIVKQCDGSISVHSTPGVGTSVRILFPAVDEESAAGVPAPEQGPITGNETVLLVEDEAGVRHYVRDVLEANGYRALDATTGADAIGIARHYTGPIHLLITDVVLPGMNGEELIREFLALRPGVPVLRMSGYSELVGVRMKGGAEYLRKPFTPSVLLHTMRGILDAGRAASAAPA